MMLLLSLLFCSLARCLVCLHCNCLHSSICIVSYYLLTIVYCCTISGNMCFEIIYIIKISKLLKIRSLVTWGQPRLKK
jgi:hypothetical protein